MPDVPVIKIDAMLEKLGVLKGCNVIDEDEDYEDHKGHIVLDEDHAIKQ